LLGRWLHEELGRASSPYRIRPSPVGQVARRVGRFTLLARGGGGCSGRSRAAWADAGGRHAPGQRARVTSSLHTLRRYTAVTGTGMWTLLEAIETAAAGG